MTITFLDNTDFDSLNQVLQDILAAIQSNLSTTETIDTIENIIVSYFETTTVMEVEES